MKRTYFLLVLLFVMSLSSCGNNTVSVGLNYSSNQETTSVYIGMEASVEEATMDEDVTLSFYHSHNIPDYYDLSRYVSHTIEVSLIEYGSNDRYILYTIEYEGSDYFVEENRCSGCSNSGSKINYAQKVELQVNFSDYDISEGKIHFMVTETILARTTDDEGNYIMHEVDDYNIKTIKFEVKDGVIIFSV